MNCLIENEYIKGTFQKKIIYVHPNELPNWKRLHKETFLPKKIYVHPNELPNWKRIHKGNFQKKNPSMYIRMSCLIENDYIRELSKKKNHLCTSEWIA